MNTADIPFLPEFFDRYINLVNGQNLEEALALDQSIFEAERIPLNALGDQVYAEGKWTIREVLQHIIDTERIMAYRALRIARGDTFNMQGFDEVAFAENAKPVTRSLQSLLDEFASLRQANRMMFAQFKKEELLAEGLTSEKRNTVLALGFVIAGHPLHHLNVIKERYYPLLENN